MTKLLSIMLVDDNEFDLFLNEKFIETKDIAKSISKFEFGNDAITFLREASLDDCPDLILLDIHMPIMDGFEFLEAFKLLSEDKKEKINIFMVSSSLDQSDNSRATENELVIALLTKPLNMDILTEKLVENGIL